MGDTSVLEEWDELATDFKELEADNKVYLEKLDELNTYQQKCLKHISHQNYRLNVIKKSLRELSKQTEHGDRVKELEDGILKRKLHLHEIEQTLPKPNGTYLKIILGNVNVSILNREAKFKYKDEYEKFKLILSIIGFVMAVLNLSVRFRPLELSFIFLLVWYYCTLTIRESILKVNGSRIKGWWRLHHFLSTVAAGILLIWPDTDTWAQFRTQFMWFNGYISNVVTSEALYPNNKWKMSFGYSTLTYLNNGQYQRGVLYRLKALGERHNMDITIEGFHSWMWRGLSFLLPFLFFGYSFQLYNAYCLYLLSFAQTATWHVPVLSLMFFVLFVGNTATTIMVIPDKVKEKVKLQHVFVSPRSSCHVLSKESEDNQSRKRD